MYTYDQRMKAVRTYIESHFNENCVIETLGYPSPNALRAWYKEYLTTGTLHKKSLLKPRYTQEQKENAVAYYANHPGSITQACRELGYPNRNVLRAWILELRPELLAKRRKSCKRSSSLLRYTHEEKYAIVEEWVISRQPVYQIAAKYHVSKASISKWKRQILGKDSQLPIQKEPKQELPKGTVKDLQSEIVRLQAEIQQLRMERDALQKAAELLKKAEGINLKNLKNKWKAIVIDALRKQYPLKDLLILFCISKSSYCYQAKRRHNPPNGALQRKIRELFDWSKGCYGYRRIYQSLKKEGKIVSEKVIRRLMRENGLIARCAKRRKYNSYEGEITPSVPNLLQRNFHATVPNIKWLTDITEFSIPAGKVYLSPIIDCFDGFVVSWTIGTSPSASLVNEMLEQATSTLKENEHPILHSDRGSHYRWPGWIERVEKAGLHRSMSRKGCSPDNAACEGFFGRLKVEMFYGRDWTHVTIEKFISILDTYIHWYNTKRIKQSLSWLSPLEYRSQLGLV